jgi:hypothetical protein
LKASLKKPSFHFFKLFVSVVVALIVTYRTTERFLEAEHKDAVDAVDMYRTSLALKTRGPLIGEHVKRSWLSRADIFKSSPSRARLYSPILRRGRGRALPTFSRVHSEIKRRNGEEKTIKEDRNVHFFFILHFFKNDFTIEKNIQCRELHA